MSIVTTRSNQNGNDIGPGRQSRAALCPPGPTIVMSPTRKTGIHGSMGVANGLRAARHPYGPPATALTTRSQSSQAPTTMVPMVMAAIRFRMDVLSIRVPWSTGRVARRHRFARRRWLRDPASDSPGSSASSLGHPTDKPSDEGPAGERRSPEHWLPE